MRRTRALLLLAILSILAGVGLTYRLQKKIQSTNSPAKPESLPLNITASQSDWVYTHAVRDRPIVEVRAKSMKHIEDPDRLQLDQVELRLFHKGAKAFDLVKSASAQFDMGQGYLYSDGEVSITLGVEAGQAPNGRLMSIRSSGVRFEAKTGVATTDKRATFSFDRGDGQSVGAIYDPNERELTLGSHVELRWTGSGAADDRAMKIEAGRLMYRERDAVVKLFPWSRLTRGTMTLEAGESTILLEDGIIRSVNAVDARGVDRSAERSLEYSARHLNMGLSPKAEIEKIIGDGEARLVATSTSGQTTVTTDLVDMDFVIAGGESLLQNVWARGRGSVESISAPKQPGGGSSTRLLKSEIVQLRMRPGGKEVEQVQTHEPGSVDLLPADPTQRKRRMEAERMSIQYGARNQIESIRAVNVSTRTEALPARKPAAAGKVAPAADPALTWSKDLQADFNLESGEVRRIEQWNNFRYQEGARNATADRGTLDQTSQAMTLDGKARTWDPTGSVSADKIVLNQKNGDFTAEWNVLTTRMPEKKGNSSAMLSGDEPLHARAHWMESTQKHQYMVFRGKAQLWQGASRIEAESIEIDRSSQVLKAHEKVVSQFQDRDKKSPSVTMVWSEDLLYQDKERLAHYREGAKMKRAGMDVAAQEIRAFLKDSSGKGKEKDSSDSGLDHAFADGAVEIVQQDGTRTRHGTAEHAEFYADEEKLILYGGQPRFQDTLRGQTRGQRLTYFSRDDRLLVEGVGTQPVVSRILRK